MIQTDDGQAAHTVFLIFCMTMCDIANKVKIASLGGIEAIIKVMSTHMDHSGVQQNACGALRNLAANYDGMCFFSLVVLVYSVVLSSTCVFLSFFLKLHLWSL